MAENDSSQSLRSGSRRPTGEESDEDDGGEEERGGSSELEGLSEWRIGWNSVATGGAESGEAESETLAVVVAEGESGSSAGLQVDSGVEERAKEESKEKDTSAELSTTSAPRPTIEEQKSLPQKLTISMPEAVKLNSSKLNPISAVAIVKTPTSDGFNWRKYGQKLVKSPIGSRSYYRCTYSGCCAKRVECCDHSGRVAEMVYKGQHDHDPPRKVSSARQNRLSSPAQSVVHNSTVKHHARMLNGSDPSISSKALAQGTSSASERKRPCSHNSDENDEMTVKEEHVNEPEAKRRVEKGNVACSGTVLKPGKKPKFVVHAASDVGISNDGYRWRKYGQKMVKGNLNPRNYYRCTSAGCPVHKHIETAVDNTSAMIITYKGIHDHDMPVPRKRHPPPSAPLVAAAAPSTNNLQQKKTEALQNQISPVDKEGELTGKALDLVGEKAMESARTLLSIGFELDPC